MSEDRILYFTPEALAVAPSPRGTIGLLLAHPDQAFGLAPGIKLAIELTPAEALDLTQKLLNVVGALQAKQSGQH